MKTLKLFVLLVVVVAIASCSSETSTTDQVASAPVVGPQQITAVAPKQDTVVVAVSSDTTKIPLKEGEFEKLTKLFGKEGFTVTERGVACDKQITLYDSLGTRHAMIAVRRDTNELPSMEAPVTQIAVWAYHDGVKDQEHFFGYHITPKEVSAYGPETSEWYSKNLSSVKAGYTELLKRASK